PSGSFTKTEKGTIKISTFMNNNPILDDFEDVLNDMDKEE
ncbi:10294_t:CDS:1, partial [Rhizophagus irregularis]